MKIYGISGLGADQRVFKYLTLDAELIPIEWVQHQKKESIEAYALRLSKAIDTGADFGILGVSFGGLIAVEISKVLKPKLTILISSAETKSELLPLFRGIGKTGILKILPAQAFDPPRKMAQFLFGTSNKQLLNNILDDTNLDFAKWAVNALTNWQNQDRINNALKIHGTQDKLLPLNNHKNVKLIERGEHFMIVDRASEISQLINKYLDSF
ncbi:alpha/beta hydrolase [Echinicola sp. CAU 1574]|uniref:Alpha/beta hydrolase n=1 Tax=Echinicola arenosa TaxID=2774144 RepID=A0ABR9ALM0_9BACT|nr:alpha/beta hydrolase [Echinicola arenosa]MBD8489698.1 alpha/beta hydrolase [Echinicola arenosa]